MTNFEEGLEVGASPAPVTGAEAVIKTANAQLGKPYKLGTEGPDTYDCSGLVWYCFDQNKLGSLIGGGRHRANWYYNWFRAQGGFSADKDTAVRGDLVFYGATTLVTHMGIYLGPTNHKLISALVNPYGVSKTRINALVTPGGMPLPIVGYGLVKY